MHAAQRLGILGAQLDLAQRQRLLVKFDGFLEPAQVLEAIRHAHHEPQRVRMIVPQDGAAPRHRLLAQRERFLISAQHFVAVSEPHDALQGVQSVWALLRGIDGAGGRELLGRELPFAEFVERTPHRHAQPGLDERLLLEAGLDDRQCLFDRPLHGHVPSQAAARCRPCRGKDVLLHEIEHRLRLRVARLGEPALRHFVPLRRFGVLPRHSARTRPQVVPTMPASRARKQHRRRQHWALVALTNLLNR